MRHIDRRKLFRITTKSIVWDNSCYIFSFFNVWLNNFIVIYINSSYLLREGFSLTAAHRVELAKKTPPTFADGDLFLVLTPHQTSAYCWLHKLRIVKCVVKYTPLAVTERAIGNPNNFEMSMLCTRMLVCWRRFFPWPFFKQSKKVAYLPQSWTHANIIPAFIIKPIWLPELKGTSKNS